MSVRGERGSSMSWGVFILEEGRTFGEGGNYDSAMWHSLALFSGTVFFLTPSLRASPFTEK